VTISAGEFETETTRAVCLPRTRRPAQHPRRRAARRPGDAPCAQMPKDSNRKRLYQPHVSSWVFLLLVSCAPVMLGVCHASTTLVASMPLSVCPHKISKNYRSEIDVTWWRYIPWRMLEVVKSWWHSTLTFDLESYFRIFSAQAFEWLYLATLFSVWRYVFIHLHGSVSGSMVQCQGHGSNKAVARNSIKNYWLEIAWVWFWHFDLDVCPWDIFSYFIPIKPYYVFWMP